LCHGHDTEGVGLEQLSSDLHRIGLEDADSTDAGIVDEYIDLPGGLDRVGNAIRAGDVEGDEVYPV